MINNDENSQKIDEELVIKNKRKTEHLKQHQYKPGVARGRPKGQKNHFTNLKEAILKTYDKKGGVKWLLKYASTKQGERDFFQAILKLLPAEAKIEVGGNLTHSMSAETAQMFDGWLQERKRQAIDVTPKPLQITQDATLCDNNPDVITSTCSMSTSVDIIHTNDINGLRDDLT